MKTIYKYPANIRDEFKIEMPMGAEILHVALQQQSVDTREAASGQREVPMIWARVDPFAPKESRHLSWRGTGHSADGLGRYIGTIQMNSGALVFHLFEGVPR